MNPFTNLFTYRPDHEIWKPLWNAEPPDETACYQAAASKLGITIKIAYPVPASAGAGVCASLGMQGIYILRTQANREHELLDEYFHQLRVIAS